MEKIVAVTVNQPVEMLYAYWRDFSNLPRLIEPLDSVVENNGRIHWKATLPGDNALTWESRLVETVPNERITWQSDENAPLKNTGSVTFSPAPANKGTEVHLVMDFDPPGGELGEKVANLLGPVPHVLAYKALYRFKALMETGEIPTLEHQPAAREDGHDEKEML